MKAPSSVESNVMFAALIVRSADRSSAVLAVTLSPAALMVILPVGSARIQVAIPEQKQEKEVRVPMVWHSIKMAS